MVGDGWEWAYVKQGLDACGVLGRLRRRKPVSKIPERVYHKRVRYAPSFRSLFKYKPLRSVLTCSSGNVECCLGPCPELWTCWG